jgi:hypothetical protein
MSSHQISLLKLDGKNDVRRCSERGQQVRYGFDYRVARGIPWLDPGYK